jgi:hypothetical protein
MEKIISSMEKYHADHIELIQILKDNKTEKGKNNNLSIFTQKLALDFDLIKYDEANILGEGGYAKVYRGSLGTMFSHEVAVKVFQLKSIKDVEPYLTSIEEEVSFLRLYK